MKTFNSYTLSSGNAEELVEKALENLAWDYKKTENGYKVNFGMNLKTVGATMEITLVNATKINISVKTKLPTQIIDSGDGFDKIEKLIVAIQEFE